MTPITQSSHKVTLSTTSKHPIALTLKHTRWPPFYAPPFLAPRYKLTLVNNGEAVDQSSVQVWVKRIDDQQPDDGSDWPDPVEVHWGTRWRHGLARRVTVKLDGHGLPRTGMYLVSVKVRRWIAQDTPYRELVDALSVVIPRPEREALRDGALERFKEAGVDPYASPSGLFTGEELAEANALEYLRVDSTTSPVTLLLFVATAVGAAATLLLMILGIVNG
jgi:hypothetical protein